MAGTSSDFAGFNPKLAQRIIIIMRATSNFHSDVSLHVQQIKISLRRKLEKLLTCMQQNQSNAEPLFFCYTLLLNTVTYTNLPLHLSLEIKAYIIRGIIISFLLQICPRAHPEGLNTGQTRKFHSDVRGGRFKGTLPTE